MDQAARLRARRPGQRAALPGRGHLTACLRITGIDPGMSNLGVAQALFSPERGIELQKVQLIETEKSNKKKGLREKADDVRRLQEIVHTFDELDRHAPADVYAFEECPTVRSAKVTRKVAMAWGSVFAIGCRRRGVLVLEYDPQALKVVVTGSKVATKCEMYDCLVQRHPLLSETGLVPSKVEHVVDAVAAITMAAQDPAVLLLASALGKVTR